MRKGFQTFFLRFVNDKYKPFAIQARNQTDACIRLMLIYSNYDWDSNRIEVSELKKFKRVDCSKLKEQAKARMHQKQRAATKRMQRRANLILPGYEKLVSHR